MRNNLIITSNGIIGTYFKEDFIKENIKQKTVLVIDNGTYGTSNYKVRKENIDKFLKYGAKKVDLITIKENNVECILRYDVCYVMGGSIANLIELVKNTNIKNILNQFLINGIYIGESAGSIILDKDVEWYFDLKRGTKPKYDVIYDIYDGLGFIDKHIYPHYNRESEEGIKKIQKSNLKIILLNDGDYLEYNI